MSIFSEVVWLFIDKFTDKIADYIKYKDLERRLKL